MNSSMSRKAIVMPLLLGLAALIAMVPIAEAQLEGVVFSVNTDKKVYTQKETIRVELVATNTGDNEPRITPRPYGLNDVSAIDLSTGAIVYSVGVAVPNPYTGGISPHAQKLLAVTDIPTGRLRPGKYEIIFSATFDIGGTTEVNVTSTSVTVTSPLG